MKNLVLLLFLLVTIAGLAQPKYPVIKATSTKVSINDGGVLEKNSWRLSPKTRPDIFTAERTRKSKWVTFYTDIDSIRVKLKPGGKFNFVILLNCKDSCFTQIASAVSPEDKSLSKIAVNDTIPFKLTAYNAIAFKAVINNTDTVNLHFDTGSWGLRLTKKAMGLHQLHEVFKLQIGKMVFDNPEFGVTDQTAHEMDGRFGWDLFDSKQVELDYDKSIMIIHSGKLRKVFKGYVRSDLAFKHSFLIVRGSMKKENQNIPADFLMDTGSEQAIILDSAWTASANFAANLQLLRTIILHNPKNVAFETKLVLAPAFFIDGFQLTDIPALILDTLNPAGFSINDLGNDVLKRFNMILDFENDKLYLKPNQLTNLKYREHA